MSAPRTPMEEYLEGLRLELERLLQEPSCLYGPLPYSNAVDLLAEAKRARAEAKRARASEARLLEALKIFFHAHATGNSVPPHIENRAREAIAQAEGAGASESAPCP